MKHNVYVIGYRSIKFVKDLNIESVAFGLFEDYHSLEKVINDLPKSDGINIIMTDICNRSNHELALKLYKELRKNKTVIPILTPAIAPWLSNRDNEYFFLKELEEINRNPKLDSCVSKYYRTNSEAIETVIRKEIGDCIYKYTDQKLMMVERDIEGDLE